MNSSLKSSLCVEFASIIKERKITFAAAAKITCMSKTQVNSIINLGGKETSLEKILNGLIGLGCKVEINITQPP